MELNAIIKELFGKEPIAMPKQTDLWMQWYQGDVNKFHNYTEYNGKEDVKTHRRTLNMAKKVAEDWANLLLNERTDVAYGNDVQKKELDELYNKVGFWQKGNEGIEKAFALANGAFVEGFDEDNNVRFQFVYAKKIYPLTFEQDKVTECAFANINSDDVVIQGHMLGHVVDGVFTPDKKGNYCIRTTRYKVVKGSTDNVGGLIDDIWFDTKSKICWFQLVKPNIANNINIGSPLGISVFANAVDVLQGVDLAYDGLCEEMRISKSKMIINKKLLQRDEEGERYIFDVNQTGFYYAGDFEGAKPIEVYAPTLRTEQYFAGINNSLNLLSSKVGFGENHYRYDQNGISTATQVISQNSEMFRTIRKHEILLYDVIVNATKALMYINNEFSNNAYKFDLDEEIKPIFDDSIIEDKESELLRDRADVQAGLMSKVEYRVKRFGESEDEARDKIKEITEQNKATNWFTTE